MYWTRKYSEKKITRSHGGLFTRIEFNGRRQLLLRLLGLDGSRLAAATGFCFIIAAINRFLLDLIDISDGRLFLLVGSDSTALLRTGKKKKKRLPRITWCDVGVGAAGAYIIRHLNSSSLSLLSTSWWMSERLVCGHRKAMSFTSCWSISC